MRQLRLAHFFVFKVNFMTDKELFWKMYSKLFNTITDVLPLIENTKVAETLKQAQIDAEEMYISYGESD